MIIAKQIAFFRSEKFRRKVMNSMKLVSTILLLFFMQLSVQAKSQSKITLKLKSVDLTKAISMLESKSEYRFVYNNSLIPSELKIDANFREADLPEVLSTLLKNSGLSYKMMKDDLVVLYKPTGNEVVADVRVTGTVTDENGKALAGASVNIKGGSGGVSTDANGTYSLNVADNAILVFSYVGYEPKEVAVGGRTGVDVQLFPSIKTSEQVIVVGYGSQRKIDVTGAVSNIKGEELAKQASISPIGGLQGKVAGVQITNSGAPGASPQIRIRGVGTVFGNSNPLYVVDGVWYDDISFLNNNDIENLSILKDASSQAIYGVRAANGVVLITTKKGRAGKAVVTYNGYVGFQTVTNQVKMANATEYATIINELYVQNGNAPLFANTNYGKGTDWYHQILRDALVTNHQVAVSGGNERSDYNLSLSYLDQDGNVETNNYKRYTARFVNNFTILPNLKAGFNITGAFSKSRDIPGGIFHQLYAAGPVVPVYYADGTYGDPSDYNLGDGNNFNPQATLDFYNQKSQNYRLTGNMYIDFKFAKHFTFHSSLGGEYGDADVRGYTPVYTATLKQRNLISSLNINQSQNRNWIVENTVTYDNKFGDHSVKFLVGQGAQRYKSYYINGSAQGVPNTSEGDLYLALGDPATRNVTDGGSLNTTVSYFGRLNYGYKDKYLLTASMRADGSSRFYSSSPWGYFPSVGAGWVVSKEKFMQTQKIFSSLKIRGSWGRIGNAVVPINPGTLIVTQTPSLAAVYGSGTGTLYPGASVNTIVPPTIGFEVGVGTDIGAEMGFLNDRLTLEVDYYKRKTEDAIFPIPVLTSIGTEGATLVGNQASFQNSGVEFNAGWRGTIRNDVNYSINGNLSINENKVLSTVSGNNALYGGGAASTGGALATRTVLGQPIGQFYGYQVAGIFQTQAEIDASSQKINTKPGDFRYVDQNNDGVIDGRDRVVLGNPNPKYTYGLSTNWAYKQFDLTVDLQGVAGVDIYNANLGLRYGNENFSKEFYDNRWHGAGTSNTYPSAGIGGGNNYLPNSFYVESGSYFRIRNLQLGYTINSKMTDRWGLKKIRAYANVQNVLTVFKYNGFSPEIGGSPLDQGIDANVYPLFATYNFGVNVTF